MKPLNRESFLAAATPHARDFTPPALGQVVRIRKLTGAGRDTFRTTVEGGDKTLSFFEAAVVVMALVDEHDAPLFAVEDIALLRDRLDSVVISQLAAEALALNKIGPAAEEAAAKN
ncbi:hypothetical protein [Robbsia andropogonis]|uniref:hypothetical protein n=1 Tax=Robbsia andropogonis TaxID=28092 RepID=UPI002A6A4D6C|nr:hypothetical protein [Robbsia andropogonis]